MEINTKLLKKLRESPNYKKRGILSSLDIYDERKADNIFINPFSLAQLQNNSYDITLGENFFRNAKAIPFFNPWCAEHVRAYWGKALKAEVATQDDAAEMGLKPGQKYILLAPGETILGHTNEFIGGANFITTIMKARSSIGRSVVTICRCAGMGDIGYQNRWTMEITNSSSSQIVLPVDSRVGQIVFYYSNVPIKSYEGKYQSTKDLDQLMMIWKPEDMLPKLSQDYDSKTTNSEEIPIPTPKSEDEQLNLAIVRSLEDLSIISSAQNDEYRVPAQ